jgi:peroxiredoxin
MQCRDFARQLAAAAPDFAARNTQVLIIGPGSRQDAERLVKAIKANPGQVLYDETGEVYDRYMLDKVFLSLLQRSAAFIIDPQGVLRYAYVVTNALRWLNSKSFTDLLTTLDSLT